LDAYFVVIESTGQSYIYFKDEPGRRSAAKLLSKDEARRIAAGIAKLPGYCAKLDAGAISMPSRLPPIRATGVQLAKSDQIHRRGSSTSHRVELLPSGFYP